MSDLEINEDLVGRKVCNPVRPEWGVGTVLRVECTTVEGRAVRRVSVQFATGHRILVAPPARLCEPQPGIEQAGWLEQLARRTPDDRLAELPAAIREFLGTSAQRIVVLARLYELDESPAGLLRWARSQTGVADPLSVWSRDQIQESFYQFCQRRDELLREAVATLRQTTGKAALNEVLKAVSPLARRRMLEAFS